MRFRIISIAFFLFLMVHLIVDAKTTAHGRPVEASHNTLNVVSLSPDIKIHKNVVVIRYKIAKIKMRTEKLLEPVLCKLC